MKRKATVLGAGLAALVLAACASSSSASNTSSPSPAASPSPSPAASATPVAVDPCQVVTQSEASQLTGVSYGAGKEEVTTEGGKLCWYGAQTTDVFEVFVGQATDAATAQAQWDAEKGKVLAALQAQTSTTGATVSANVNDTSISGADRAAAGTLSYTLRGVTISGTAVYMLKGVYFVAIVDILLNGAPPTVAVMEAEGRTALGRIP